jgi:hypothetical protein
MHFSNRRLRGGRTLANTCTTSRTSRPAMRNPLRGRGRRRRGEGPEPLPRPRPARSSETDVQGEREPIESASGAIPRRPRAAETLRTSCLRRCAQPGRGRGDREERGKREEAEEGPSTRPERLAGSIPRVQCARTMGPGIGPTGMLDARLTMKGSGAGLRPSGTGVGFYRRPPGPPWLCLLCAHTHARRGPASPHPRSGRPPRRPPYPRGGAPFLPGKYHLAGRAAGRGPEEKRKNKQPEERRRRRQQQQQQQQQQLTGIFLRTVLPPDARGLCHRRGSPVGSSFFPFTLSFCFRRGRRHALGIFTSPFPDPPQRPALCF